MADWSFWQYLGVYASSALVGSGFAAWVVKQFFLHRLNEKLADHRALLDEKLENHKLSLTKELEVHKSALQRDVVEFQIKRSLLLERRIETIWKTHNRIHQYRIGLERLIRIALVNGSNTKPAIKLLNELSNQHRELYDMIVSLRLILPKPIHLNLDSIMKKFAYYIGYASSLIPDLDAMDYDKEERKYIRQELRNMHKDIPEKLIPMENLTIHHFQHLIGTLSEEFE